MKALKEYTIGVFRGGTSPERDISLVSGGCVIEALKSKDYSVVDVDLKTENGEKICEIINSKKIDLVFVALHGGFGEDGRFQKILEEKGVLFTSSGADASHKAMDKLETRKILEADGIPFPRYWQADINLPPDISRNFPLVVKPHYGGSSVGVSVVKNDEEIERALKRAKDISENILVEEYITGRELTVGVVGDKVLPVVEMKFKNDFFDFSCKYEEDKTEFLVPADLPGDIYKQIQQLSFRVYQSLGCEVMGRVDLRLDSDLNPYVLELNSVPGLTTHSLLPLAAKYIGWDFPTLCEQILALAVNSKCKQHSK